MEKIPTEFEKNSDGTKNNVLFPEGRVNVSETNNLLFCSKFKTSDFITSV